MSSPSNIDFICHAFKSCATDETPWVAGFQGDLATASHSVWFGGSALPLPAFIRPSHNNYVCISTFKRAADGNYRRRKDCFSGLHVVLLDDLGTKISFDKLRLEPSCLVETSPGNFQAWLFLNEPERCQQRAEALINGLISSGATDEGAGNITRFGRLPVGVNGKAKYADENGKPFVQRVAKWAPERSHSADEVANAYSITLSITARTHIYTGQNRIPPAHSADGYIDSLVWAGLYLEELRGIEGAHRIVCPWHNGHTGGDTTGTVYFSPTEGNSWQGGFKCQHGHCKDRNIHDFNRFALGLLRLRKEKAAA